MVQPTPRDPGTRRAAKFESKRPNAASSTQTSLSYDITVLYTEQLHTPHGLAPNSRKRTTNGDAESRTTVNRALHTVRFLPKALTR